MLNVTPAIGAGLTDKLWEMDDLVAMPEQWEPANIKPEYQFVVRQYAIGKGRSVSVLWRGGEVDRIFGFEKEADALDWIRTKPQGRLVKNKGRQLRRPILEHYAAPAGMIACAACWAKNPARALAFPVMESVAYAAPELNITVVRSSPIALKRKKPRP